MESQSNSSPRPFIEKFIHAMKSREGFDVAAVMAIWVLAVAVSIVFYS